MSGSLKDDVPKLMDRLGLNGKHLQNVKLGPGVVGRNSSIAWVGGIVMLAGVIAGGFLHSEALVGGALLGAAAIAVGIPWLNVRFAKENAAAALLEGAEFVEFHHMQISAAKGSPTISLEAPVTAPPSLSGRDPRALPRSEENRS